MAKPLTDVVKPEVPATTAPTPEYSEAAWVELELKRSLMKQHRLGQILRSITVEIDVIQKLEREFESAAGSREIANREKLLFAVKNAGKDGLPLAYAHFFIRETNDLVDARKFLKRTKDEDGNPVAPVIREVRGDNNELTIFYLDPKEKKSEEPQEDGETEGGDEAEA